MDTVKFTNSAVLRLIQKVPCVAGVFLCFVVLYSSDAASSVWRDEVRKDAQKFNHTDYPDYERPDKQDFFDQFEMNYGIQDTTTLIVKFQNGFDPDEITNSIVFLDSPDEKGGLSDVLAEFNRRLSRHAVVSYVEVTNDVPSDVLESDRLEAEFFAGKQFPDLRLYYTIHLDKNLEPGDLLSSILEDDNIEVAYYNVPMELTADLSPITPDFSQAAPVQRHLDTNIATGGLGARDFWGIPGGTGSGVRAAVYEFAATTSHEDFPTFYTTIGSGSFSQWEDDADHGTATLGIIGARNNGYGTTGIAPESSLIFATDGYLSTLTSSTYTRAGDVISISMATDGCPVIQTPNVFTTLDIAVSRGVLVFVGAGNAAKDITGSCSNVPLTSVSVVGGGTADTSHRYSQGSNYGTSIKLQGWYSNIVTTGYGTLWGNSHTHACVSFPEYPGTLGCPNSKSMIPDDSVVLIGDYDNTPATGDDIVSCWPLVNNICVWHWTKNNTGTIAAANKTVAFGNTSNVGAPLFLGNLTYLYVMGDFNNIGNDDVVYYDTTSGLLKFMDIAQTPYPVATTVLLSQGQTVPTTNDQMFAADVNDDGLKDLVLSRQSGTSRQWWAAINVLNGTTVTFPQGFQPLSIGGSQLAYLWTDNMTFGDYDEDGIDDVIAARDGGYYGKEWWYSKGSGSQTFATGQRIVLYGMGLFRSNLASSTYVVTDILGGRLDNDSHMDFIARMNDSELNDRDDSWDAVWRTATPKSNANRQLYTPTFSGTSGATPMVAGAAAAIQGVFRADGSSGCDQEAMEYLLSMTGEPQGVDANFYAGRLIGSFPNLLRAAEYLFLHSQLMVVNYNVQSGVSGDIPFNGNINGLDNGVEKDDIFFFRPSNNTFYYSKNLGIPYFSAPTAASFDFTDFLINTVSVGDVNGDHKDDLVVKSTSGLWIVFLNNTTSTIATFNWYLSSVGNGVDRFTKYDAVDKFMLGDIDGDGKEDLIIRTYNPPYWSWAKSGGLAFGEPQPLNIGITNYNVFSSSDQIKFADINGDGYDDLVARTGSDDTWLVSMNNRNNSLHEPIRPIIDGMLDYYGTSDELISVGDYTGDGIADIFVRIPSTLRWFLNNHVSGWN